MLPDLSVLVSLLIGLYAMRPGQFDPLVSGVGTLALVAIGLALLRMSSERAQAAVRGGEIERGVAAAHGLAVIPPTAWFACVLFLDWGVLVHEWVPREAWLARYAVLLAPGAALFVASWAERARVESTVHAALGRPHPTAGLRTSLASNARRNALALLPFAVIVGVMEAVWILGRLGVPGMRRTALLLETMELLQLLVVMVLMTLLTLIVPLLLRRVMHTESLEPGRLRERIEESARAMGLRYGHLVVWKTGRRVLNAMVVGVTARTRTIFLTDGLLATLPEDEVLAVFAHEAGHAKRHHLQLFLVLFFSLALAFHLAVVPLVMLGIPPLLVIFAHVAILYFVLLGWVSRRFEREADVFGAENAGLEPPPDAAPSPLPAGASAMMRALERIHRVTGHTGGFRHGSVLDRMRFVAAHATDPEVRLRFRRARRALVAGVLVFAVAVTAGAAAHVPADLRLARSVIHADQAGDAYDRALALQREGREADARAAWGEALESFVAARDTLADAKGPTARMRAIHAAHGVADVYVHGLRDRGAAAGAFRDVLRLVEGSDFAPADMAPFTFHAHVDLGRIAAGEDRTDEAKRHLARASALADIAPGDRDWMRARLRLLAAVIEARTADRATAIAKLEALARSRGEGDTWEELRRDAREEIDRLAAE